MSRTMNLRLGADFMAGMLTGLAIGYYLDTWLGTSPFLMVAFITLGFLAGCRTLFKEINHHKKNNEDDLPHA